MTHDQGPHKSGRDTPRACPYVIQDSFFVGKLYFEGLGKILPQEVRCTSLQSFSILHEGFYTISIISPSKAFTLSFMSTNHRDTHIFFYKGSIYIVHFLGFFHSFLTCGMGGMSFLPKKLSGTEEEASAHLPTHNICPLVNEQGKVTVGLYPVLIGVPNNGLTGGANNELFLQFCLWIYHKFSFLVRVCLEAIVRYYSTLFGKAFGIFFLRLEITFRDENRKISVLVSCILEHFV